MIQELHRNNVRAICVFDGKERSAAKQREVSCLAPTHIPSLTPSLSGLQIARRREQREVANARGVMEVQRLSRLTQLTTLITSYESLPEGEKAEVATSLQNTIKYFPVDLHPIDEMPLEWEVNRPNTDNPSASNVSPRSVNRDASVDSALDRAASGLGSLSITTESAESEPPPIQTIVDQSEESAASSPGQVPSMLAALYSGFLVSVRQMGALLSPRTVLPRPEEQDDETKVTQELSQAQRQLVMEEERIWRRLSEMTSKEGTEGEVSFLARELEDKSAKILTSYERRKSPPTNEVYNQSRIILQAMGVPCVNAKGGVEGEALAAAIVQGGFADYVASEDTVSFYPAHFVFLLVDQCHRMYWFMVYLFFATSLAVPNLSHSLKDTRSETHWI